MNKDFILSNVAWSQKEAHSFLGETLYFNINPTEIKLQIRKTNLVRGDTLQDKIFFDFFIIGGDWDKCGTPFSQDHDFKLMLDLFNYRKDFRDSPSYKFDVNRIREGLFQKDYLGKPMFTNKALEDNYNYYLGLLNSIEKSGYMNSAKSPKINGDEPIGVSISSNGEFFHFRTGHHRLATAQILNLSEIPIKIQLVHMDWININTSVWEFDYKSLVKSKLKSFKEQYEKK